MIKGVTGTRAALGAVMTGIGAAMSGEDTDGGVELDLETSVIAAGAGPPMAGRGSATE